MRTPKKPGSPKKPAAIAQADHRVVPLKLHESRRRHWEKLKRALFKVQGGSFKSNKIVQNLVLEGVNLKIGHRLTSTDARRLALRLIEQATILADQFVQAEKLVNKKDTNWNQTYSGFLEQFEKNQTIPQEIVMEIRRLTIPPGKNNR